MRGFTILLITLLTCTGVYAQTPVPTATVHPDALDTGVYKFSGLSSPDISLSGAGWFIANPGSTSLLANNQNGSSMTFYVNERADYLLLYRRSMNLMWGSWSICVDAICQEILDYGYSDGIAPVPIELHETNSTVTITKTRADTSYYDFMVIAHTEIEASGTIAPESTPEPYAVYGTVDGESGAVETRFDYLVTAGDVGIGVLLIVLFFSGCAAVIINRVANDDVQK